MTFSYVIRTLNEAMYLRELLAALSNQKIECHEYEIVVVDSGSEDGTVEIAKEFNANIVSIQRSEFTFGRSLNLGCNASKGDILFFISGHCIPVDNKWALELAKPIINQECIYAFGKQIGARTTKFSEHQIFHKNFPDHAINSTCEIGFFCNNANSALLKDTWLNTNFDEDLTGLEDLDLAKKLTASGFKLSYQNNACVYHIHDESYSQIFMRYKRESIALKKIMPEIHFHIIDFLRYTLSSIFFDLITAAKSKLLWNEIFGIFTFRFLQYYGTLQGYQGHGNVTKATKDSFFYPEKKHKKSKNI